MPACGGNRFVLEVQPDQRLGRPHRRPDHRPLGQFPRPDRLRQHAIADPDRLDRLPALGRANQCPGGETRSSLANIDRRSELFGFGDLDYGFDTGRFRGGLGMPPLPPVFRSGRSDIGFRGTNEGPRDQLIQFFLSSIVCSILLAAQVCLSLGESLEIIACTLGAKRAKQSECSRIA